MPRFEGVHVRLLRVLDAGRALRTRSRFGVRGRRRDPMPVRGPRFGRARLLPDHVRVERRSVPLPDGVPGVFRMVHARMSERRRLPELGEVFVREADRSLGSLRNTRGAVSERQKRPPRSGVRCSENFTARFGHENRVFELSRKAAVFGDDCPTVG
jgi:hypothetical protein